LKKPAKSKVAVLAQVCKLIPIGLVPKLAHKYGIDKQARSFSPWSHVVALLYAQLTHAFGLNDVCDALRIHGRKLAAKLHLRLDLQSFLPGYAIIEEASHHDDTRAPALCANLKDGEIALFDKAYINFRHLFNLHQRGVFWVTRAKDNMSYRVRKKLQHKRKPGSKIIRDDLVILTTAKSKEQYPEKLRRVEMLVEIDGKEIVMVFITNNTKWAATSVGALYQARWGIEVFFKQIKQTLKVCDFLGHSKHAIRWQLWSALLVYILLRYQSQLVGWSHSFIRLFAMVRGVTWSLLDLTLLLKSYGTASGSYRYRA